jgi:general secretion pathway protein C
MQLVDRIVAPLRRPAGGGAGFAAAAPAIVSVALAIVIAAQLASLVWRTLGTSDDGATAEVPAVDSPGPAVDLPALVNAHLFGAAAASGDPNDAPATTANLTLSGTLAGREPEHGWAIIGANGQPARVYATGTSLPGGAKLFAVYPDRVILDRSGARESLLLPRMTVAGGAPPPRMAGALPGVPQGNALADNVRRLLVQNPQAAGDLLRPQPVFAGSSLRGYRVYPGRNRAQFSSLGLQPGDLVMAVNGAALDDPNRGLEILRGVGQGGAVNLTIERGGQQQQVTIDPSAAMQQAQPPAAAAQEPEFEDEEEPVEEEPVEDEPTE